MTAYIVLIVGIIIAYCLGSISTAIVIAKIAGLPDPRTQSSQNPGATNMLRIGGTKYAVLTLLGDALKGFIAVIIGLLLLHARSIGLSLMATAVVLGHMYPIFFRFHGGKGVATTLGALFPLSPVLGAIILITWIVIAALTRFSSLASLISAIALPFMAIAVGHPAYFVGLALITILIIFRHRHNIKRLCNGEENRLFGNTHSNSDNTNNDH